MLARKPKLALVTAPTFAEYEAALEAWGCPVRRCLLREGQDFRLGEDFLRAITPEVDMVFLCEPNNPTGPHLPPGLPAANRPALPGPRRPAGGGRVLRRLFA